MSKCVACGEPSTLLCDGRMFMGERVPMKASIDIETTSCDAPLCLACTMRVASYHLRTSKGCRWDSIDLCPKCVEANPS